MKETQRAQQETFLVESGNATPNPSTRVEHVNPASPANLKLKDMILLGLGVPLNTDQHVVEERILQRPRGVLSDPHKKENFCATG